MEFLRTIPEVISAGIYSGTDNVAFHSHGALELVFVCSGSCSVVVKGEITLSGGAGALFILPAFTEHNQLHFEKTKTIYVCAQVETELFSDSPRTLNLGGDLWVSRWLENISRLRLEQEGSEEIAGLFYSVLCRIRRLEGKSKERSKLHPTLVRTLEYMDRNICADLSRDEIASNVGISASHLALLFRLQFKTGLMAYFQNLRLHYAESLLFDPYLSVKEVAERCGYTDSNYFCRIFKRKRGLSPGEFQRQKRTSSILLNKAKA